jgi:hypothetical protein
MGLKAIKAMRDELWKKSEALGKFKDAASSFNEAHAKIAAAYDNVEKIRKENLAKVEGLDTLGIKEFEDYKKSLVAVYVGFSNRPLPTKPLEDVIKRQSDALEQAVKERVAKLAASFPAEVKPGMVFRFEPTGALWEIKSGPTKSSNPNLKGDAALWYDQVSDTGSKFPINLADLKKSCKYIKT